MKTLRTFVLLATFFNASVHASEVPVDDELLLKDAKNKVQSAFERLYPNRSGTAETARFINDEVLADKFSSWRFLVATMTVPNGGGGFGYYNIVFGLRGNDVISLEGKSGFGSLLAIGGKVIRRPSDADGLMEIYGKLYSQPFSKPSAISQVGKEFIADLTPYLPEKSAFSSKRLIFVTDENGKILSTREETSPNAKVSQMQKAIEETNRAIQRKQDR